jgi:hypothetical protein
MFRIANMVKVFEMAIAFADFSILDSFIK